MQIPIEESQLREEAKGCNSCLDWHHRCNAECCRYFTINGTIPERGLASTFLVPLRATPDLVWYYKLHGIKYAHGFISIPFNQCKQVGDRIYVMAKCSNLTDDNKCAGHPNNKPRVCRDLTLETVKQDILNGSECTPNCLFRYKEEST